MTDRLFVWQVFEDGKWSMIAAVMHGVPYALVTTSRVSADRLGVFAVAHHDATGLPVRKAVFVLDHVMREVP